MIYFRKILEYDPTFEGKYDEYDGYSKITLQKLDPEIIVNQHYKLDLPKNVSQPIFCSPLTRAKQTAQKHFKLDGIEVLEDLQEIKFDMHKLLSKQEYKIEKSNLVRKRFIEAFINDELSESSQTIQRRLDSVLSKVSHLEPGNYLVISHSFFLKILQCYLAEKDLFKKPALLKVRFNPNKKTFDFGSGFELEL
ncbi:hypothetical protein C4564_05930 [Candidatus Microgenomates bacterium]|nr:MAG: hypothetical protein C4564_05930 [Candidatus Microgenomates bacterium]